MASISHSRLIEMEAEMDRFEQEILSQPSASDLPRVVIGSNTYNQVSAQLKMLRAQSGMSVEERERRQREVASQLKALRAATEIQMMEREDSGDDGDEPDKYSIVDRYEPPAKKPLLDPSLSMLPPPPPPPSLAGSSTPSFMPPQLRRAPPPPPSGPPMSGPPRMRPPHSRPFGGGGGPMGPQGPGPGHMPGYHPGPMGHMGGPSSGPMRMQGPPGPHMGGGPPRPGFMHGPGGPRPMLEVGAEMYGVSSGEDHYGQEKEDSKVSLERPKVVYASAPVINLPKKEKKKKKKKKAEESDKTETKEKKAETSSSTGSSMEVPAGPSLPSHIFTSTTTGSSSTNNLDPDDNLQLAEMDMDGTAMTRKERKEKKKKFVRLAAGKTWEDQSLMEWDQDDFRLFCGDLGNEVTDEVLARAFSKYSSFVKAKVVRDKRSNKTKGYGFVSFRDPTDYVRAMREMNGKYVGNRPIKLRKSNWKDRNIDVVKRKEREKKRLGLK